MDTTTLATGLLLGALIGGLLAWQAARARVVAARGERDGLREPRRGPRDRGGPGPDGRGAATRLAEGRGPRARADRPVRDGARGPRPGGAHDDPGGPGGLLARLLAARLLRAGCVGRGPAPSCP